MVLKTNAEIQSCTEQNKKKIYITGKMRYEDFDPAFEKKKEVCMYTTTYRLARNASEADENK